MNFLLLLVSWLLPWKRGMDDGGFGGGGANNQTWAIRRPMAETYEDFLRRHFLAGIVL